MVLGKKVAIFDWEWGRNSAPRDGQKRPCSVYLNSKCSQEQSIIPALLYIKEHRGLPVGFLLLRYSV